MSPPLLFTCSHCIINGRKARGMSISSLYLHVLPARLHLKYVNSPYTAFLLRSITTICCTLHLPSKGIVGSGHASLIRMTRTKSYYTVLLYCSVETRHFYKAKPFNIASAPSVVYNVYDYSFNTSNI